MKTVDIWEFNRVYQESGEVSARLILDTVHPTWHYHVFADNPELAHWLKSFQVSDDTWLRLMDMQSHIAGHYLQYCDLSKRGFSFICQIVLWNRGYHPLLDFHQVSQEMWSRLVLAVSREDIGIFYQYLDRQALSGEAQCKLGYYEYEYLRA